MSSYTAGSARSVGGASHSLCKTTQQQQQVSEQVDVLVVIIINDLAASMQLQGTSAYTNP
jgi:hypothetical protein